MPATPISSTQRYIRAGTTKVVLVDSIASTTLAATRAEINGGTEVAGEISSATGFSQTSNSVETPDWGSRITTKIPGRITIEDSSITFYGDEDGADIREVLVRDQDINVIFMDGGDVAATPMDVFKTTVSSITTTKDDGPVMVVVSFTVRQVGESLPIPA